MFVQSRGFFSPEKSIVLKGKKDPVVRKEGKPEFTRKRVSLYTPLATRGPLNTTIHPYEEQLPPFFKIFFF